MLPPLAPATGSSATQLMSGLKFAAALRERGKDRRDYARRHYRQFCASAKIQQTSASPTTKSVSAAWIDCEGNEVDQIIHMAHWHDLIVLRAASAGDGGFSPEEAGGIILSRGGPMMLAPPHPSSDFAGTIAIAWKNTPEAASALWAAMPLLYRADKIVAIAVATDDDGSDPTIDDVVMRLRWHGLDAIADPIKANQSLPARCLMEHVESLVADLLVMGAYGRNRLHEYIFGSFTKNVLSGTSLPVFLTH
jgi:hypothetical protein